jgi:hypothetical protein
MIKFLPMPKKDASARNTRESDQRASLGESWLHTTLTPARVSGRLTPWLQTAPGGGEVE